MENVTDRTLNPFGMRPPCRGPCPGGHDAVFGYGDVNADVHLIGDHPGIHGGSDTGIPFTGTAMGPLRAVLREVGLFTDPDPGDGADGDRPDGPGATADTDPATGAPYLPVDCYCSYLHPCCPPADGPDEDDYTRLEPFFDAELRAIAAHVLVPVGDRALAHVLREYTSRAASLPADAARLHAREVRGRGFLVVPVRDPAEWTDGDQRRLVSRLRTLLDGDYRQTADLGRFVATEDSYLVR